MQIEKNKVVAIHYTLKSDNGDVIDQTNKEGESFAFIHGVGNIIPGLEKALEGKQSGDQVSVKIPPEEAYGQKDENLTQTISREFFQGVDNVEPGMQFQAQNEQGVQIVTVTGVEGDNVTVDMNHPLAGETLNFEVEIVEVRDASEEEISHGHVHGPNGHNH